MTRFRAGTRARQAQSRAKKLEKIDRISRGTSDGAALEFAFKPPERSGRVVFELEGGRVSVGERTLLRDGELWLERGERVSLVGPNGAGKTTLIEALAGFRELGAPAEGGTGPIVEGKLRTGHNVKLGFLSQHAEELNTGTARTVLEATTHVTKLTPNKARALLGRFMFSGEESEKPLDGLSGGERRRLSLAILVHSGANVLILDEPTNHLDLESREALEQGLSAFQGSLLLVSHDRALLDAVGTRTVAFEDATLHSYVGGWPEYVRAREERARTASAKPPAPAAKRKRPAHAKAAAPPKKSTRPSRNQQQLEREIEEAEAALRAVEEELADPGAWSDPKKTARSTARHERARPGRRGAVRAVGGDRGLGPEESSRTLWRWGGFEPGTAGAAARLLRFLERGRIRVDPATRLDQQPHSSAVERRVREAGYPVRAHALREREHLVSPNRGQRLWVAPFGRCDLQACIADWNAGPLTLTR